ncbi:Uncharacterised protein [Vibrio cholerae]|nr:Uncharacterised protein [Vibrio cholerae]
MPRNVDHIIDASHDEEIPVVIKITAITGYIITGELRQIARLKTVMVTPYGWQAAWW